MTPHLPNSIESECSEYLKINIPIYKLLPSGDVFKKVKVRNRSTHEYSVEHYMDMAFETTHYNISLRSVVGSLTKPTDVERGMSIYNIYPMDGFKILYNPMGSSYEDIVKPLSHEDVPITEDIFRMTFVDGTLHEAMSSGSDVIIYGIKYFYAIESGLISEMETI